ncbi:hypothetical protein C0J52_27348, partial [Blattella germanica]
NSPIIHIKILSPNSVTQSAVDPSINPQNSESAIIQLSVEESHLVSLIIQTTNTVADICEPSTAQQRPPTDVGTSDRLLQLFI